tara:strand:- start:147643 stop:147798 length:156 start_codon:yes stop_codon:yes gene_type:complete
MFEGLAGEWVIATKESPTDTPLNTMQNLDFRGIKDFVAGQSRHQAISRREV